MLCSHTRRSHGGLDVRWVECWFSHRTLTDFYQTLRQRFFRPAALLSERTACRRSRRGSRNFRGLACRHASLDLLPLGTSEQPWLACGPLVLSCGVEHWTREDYAWDRDVAHSCEGKHGWRLACCVLMQLTRTRRESPSDPSSGRTQPSPP